MYYVGRAHYASSGGLSAFAEVGPGSSSNVGNWNLPGRSWEKTSHHHDSQLSGKMLSSLKKLGNNFDTENTSRRMLGMNFGDHKIAKSSSHHSGSSLYYLTRERTGRHCPGMVPRARQARLARASSFLAINFVSGH